MAKRLIITFFVILTINFCLPRLMRSDPFIYLSDDGSGLVIEFSEEQIQKYRSYYELDKSLPVQFLSYLINALKGNLGYSIHLNAPVTYLILSRVFWTIGVVLISMIVSVVVGIVIGSISAWHVGSILDTVMYKVAITASQIPGFIFGTVILLIFSTVLRGVFPIAGGITPFKKIVFSFDVIIDIFKHGVLPVLTLSIVRLPECFLLMRASMLNEIQKKYVVTAKAKGLKNYIILLKHCVINAVHPIIVRIFMSLGNVFGGALVVENIFAYPGVGKLMRDAVFFRDYILIQGIFLIITILVLFFTQISEYMTEYKNN